MAKKNERIELSDSTDIKSDPNSLVVKPLNKFKVWFKENLSENILLISTVIAVCLGIGLGFLLRELAGPFENKNIIMYMKFVGDLFLRMLKFLILPLIGSSLVSGIAGLGSTNGGRIAVRALVYYFISTFMAVIIGIILVVAIQPGTGVSKDILDNDDFHVTADKHVTTYDTILDLIRNLFPDNIIEMCFTQYQTVNVPQYKYKMYNDSYFNGSYTIYKKLPENFTNGTNGFALQYVDYYKATASRANGLNVLGLIVFCFVFGGVLASMGEEGRPMIKLFDCLNDASIRIIKLVMMISPLGIFSLILGTIVEMKDPGQIFNSISLYVVTVIVGLIVHGCIFLPFVFWAITRQNVFTYTRNVLEALLIALATASSTAALPTSLRCTEDKNKINKNISRFVLPVGATVNMNGTALYEAVAVIFIAQLNGKEMTFVDYVLASVTATLASIGAASVPSAGLITMIIILSALDLPADQISLIYTIDWFLDRLRTSINVWGDLLGAGIVQHLSKKEVADMELRDREKEGKENDSFSISSKNLSKDAIEKFQF